MDMPSFILMAFVCAVLYLCTLLFLNTTLYYGLSPVLYAASGFISFLFQMSFVVLAAGAARGMVDAIRRRLKPVLCQCLYWLLDLGYIASMVYFMVRFILLETPLVSGILGVYRDGYGYTFGYTMTLLIILSAISLASLALPTILKRVTRKKTIKSIAVLECILPTLACTCVAITAHIITFSFLYVDYAPACIIALIVVIVYYCLSVLRGLILGAIRGDFISSILTRPLLTLLEKYRMFKPGLSFAERTGLSVWSMWSIGYALRLIPSYVLIGSVVLLSMTCVYTIAPDQEALLYRFGALQEDSVKTPGLHFKLPWPIDRIGLYSVDKIRTLIVGYLPSDSKDFLWTSAHGGEENQLVLGNGNELIAINVSIKYTISDVKLYATRFSNPRYMLDADIYDIMLTRTAVSNLDNVLNVDRRQLSYELRDQLNEFAQANDLGVHIQNVVISSIHPPIDLADVYQGVVGASFQKETIITNALAEAEKKTIDAAWQKESAILQATISRTNKISSVKRDMSVYENAFAAYLQSPESYLFIRQLKTSQKVIANQRLYIFSPNAMRNLDNYIIQNGAQALVIK